MEYYVGYIESVYVRTDKFIVFDEETLSARIINTLELRWLLQQNLLFSLVTGNKELGDIKLYVESLGNKASNGLHVDKLEEIASNNAKHGYRPSVMVYRGDDSVDKLVYLVTSGFSHGISPCYYLLVDKNDRVECRYSCYNSQSESCVTVHDNTIVEAFYLSTNIVLANALKVPSNFNLDYSDSFLIAYDTILFIPSGATVDAIVLPKTIRYIHILPDTSVQKLVLNDGIEKIVTENDFRIKELYVPRSIKCGLITVLREICGVAPRQNTSKEYVEKLIQEEKCINGINVEFY